MKVPRDENAARVGTGGESNIHITASGPSIPILPDRGGERQWARGVGGWSW
jgi:hypothetical protein